MSNIKLKLNDFTNHSVVTIPEPGMSAIGIDLDGLLKIKDENGKIATIGNTVIPTLTNMFVSPSYVKNPDKWIILPGDNIEEALGKIAYGLDQILLVDVGVMNVFVKDSNLPIDAIIKVTNSLGEVVFDGITTNGILSKIFPRDKYTVALNAVGYETISSTLSDNDNSNNLISSNIYSNVDVGAFSTDIVFNVKPTYEPIVNGFTINEGSPSSSNSNLRLNIDISGIASEISISRLESTLGTTWIKYTPGDVPYQFDYASEITLVLFLKARNSTGESAVFSASINMVNGVSRSDSSTKYNSLKVCLSDIIGNYPNGLDKNVTINVTSEVSNISEHMFFFEGDNFNIGTPFYLHINGNNNLTIDCHTGGGFRLDYCDNIIFHGIKFINVSNYNAISVPELLSAIYLNVCNGIGIYNCSMDGLYPKSPLLDWGRYGIVCIDNNNITIAGCSLSNFGLRAIDIQNTKVVSILKCNISSCYILRGKIGQPAIIELKNVELLKIEDCTLNGEGADTVISGSNIDRTYINRSFLINCPGEILSLSNSSKSKILSIKNCSIKNNLTSPYYGWTKQIMEIGGIELIEFINNSVILSAVSGNNLYAKLISAIDVVDKLRFFNNLIEYSMPTFTNNASEAVIVQISSVSTIEWDYNIYKDYTTNNLTISNMILNIISASSIVKASRLKSLTSMRAIGLDTNSIVTGMGSNLFVGGNLSLIDPAFYNNASNQLYLPPYDLEKKKPGTQATLGCSYVGGTLGTSVSEIEYKGLYLVNESTFQETDLAYVMNSGSEAILSIDKYNDEGIFVWTLSCVEDDDVILVGSNVLTVLYSNLDGSGSYQSDRNYSLKIDKID
jgi:hypothetical protein